MAYINLTTENFNETVEKNDTIIIDFWAEWCGPCKQFGPIFEMVAEENPDITFAKVNTDEQQELAAQFQIRSIPTVIIIKEQIVIMNQAGAIPEESFPNILKQVRELDMDKVREDIANEEAKA